MSEFHDADGQPVTLCLTEAVTVGGELHNLDSKIYMYIYIYIQNVICFVGIRYERKGD